jgi:succinate dehydrogenase / fumarate reductase cytochrome b subunit
MIANLGVKKTGGRGGRPVYTYGGMGNNHRRPIYLNLFRIRLPVAGVVSILHRLSGVLLVLLLPGALYLLDQSLRDPAAFAGCLAWLSSRTGKLLTLLTLGVLALHFFSGLRHLLLDIDIGVGKVAARRSAWLTLAASLLTVAVIGAVW